jgi:hypothetical protein
VDVGRDRDRLTVTVTVTVTVAVAVSRPSGGEIVGATGESLRTFFFLEAGAGLGSAKHWLTVVRMYWRCENEGHWTADVVWKEDARRTPWIREPRAIFALSSLRMLALNILAVLRKMSRREWEQRPLPWREATRLAYFALANPTRSIRMRFSCD